ncbi:MAG: hypothetical protein WC861_01790 [Candidatus Micrarchaeia archaeon]|jgi:hypothetical protein
MTGKTGFLQFISANIQLAKPVKRRNPGPLAKYGIMFLETDHKRATAWLSRAVLCGGGSDAVKSLLDKQDQVESAGYPSHHYNRGMVKFSLGDKEGGMAEIRAAIAIYKEQPGSTVRDKCMLQMCVGSVAALAKSNDIASMLAIFEETFAFFDSQPASKERDEVIGRECSRLGEYFYCNRFRKEHMDYLKAAAYFFENSVKFFEALPNQGGYGNRNKYVWAIANAGLACHEMGDHAEDGQKEQLYRKAVKLYYKFIEQYYQDDSFFGVEVRKIADFYDYRHAAKLRIGDKTGAAVDLATAKKIYANRQKQIDNDVALEQAFR